MCYIEYGQWLALPLVKSKMGRGWHWGWCGSWCHNKKRIFDSTWSEIMEAAGSAEWMPVLMRTGEIGELPSLLCRR
jgi:hypothetical protein